MNLISVLRDTNETHEIIYHIRSYLENNDDDELVWSVFTLSGLNRCKLISARELYKVITSNSQYSEQIIHYCKKIVGNPLEAISLLYEPNEIGETIPNSTAHFFEDIAPFLEGQDYLESWITKIWVELPYHLRHAFCLLICNETTKVIDKKTLVETLALHYGQHSSIIQLRLAKKCYPSKNTWQRVIKKEVTHDEKKLKPDRFDIIEKDNIENLADSKHFPIKIQTWPQGKRYQFIFYQNSLLVWNFENELELYEDSCGLDLPGSNYLHMECIFLGFEDKISLSSYIRQILKNEKESSQHTKLSIIKIHSSDHHSFRSTIPLTEMEWIGNWDWLQLHHAQLCHQITDIQSHRELVEFINRKDVKNSDKYLFINNGCLTQISIPQKPLMGVLLYAVKSSRKSRRISHFGIGVWREKELVSIGSVSNELNEIDISHLEEWISQNKFNTKGLIIEVSQTYVLSISYAQLKESTKTSSGMRLENGEAQILHYDLRPEDADKLDSL